MSPSLAVFDRGRPSASVPSTSHCPSDPFNPSISNRHHDNQAASAVFILPTTRPSSKLATLPPVLTLRSLSKRFIPPPTTAATNTQHVRSHTSLLYQWLPPSCQTSCFFSVGTLLVFPGNSIVLPTPLLEKQLPYVYVCSCDTNKPTLPLSPSSITVNHAMPRRFNGAMFGLVFSSPITNPLAPTAVHNLPATPTFAPTPETDTNKPSLPLLHCPITVDRALLRRFNGAMFGQVFSSPILQPLAPTTDHHLSETATFPPIPEAVFPDDVATHSALPQSSTVKVCPLPHQFLGTMFGQDFYSTVTVALTPEPVAPPPVAPPPVVISTTLPNDPIPPPGPISVVASTLAPTPTLSDFSSLFHPSSIPCFPIFCQMYSRPLILKRPPPKPPHPSSTAHLHNLYSYKLLG
jgi:hypothetical protein